MARSVSEIYNGMIAQVQGSNILGPLLTSNSATAIWRLLLAVVAFAIFLHESLFDVHTLEIDENLRTRKTPNRQWYRDLCLNYQHGFSIIAESDRFDNTNYTDAQIAASKQINYCAVIRQVLSNGRVNLRIKTASSNGTDLVQTPAAVLAGLTAYLDGGAACAGDNYVVEGLNYDKIKMKWLVKYDPLILSNTGARLDGTASQPVRDAIVAFLKSGMPFSGIYEPIKHQSFVELVPGAKLPIIQECLVQYGNYGFTAVGAQYNPDAGWIRFDQASDLVINYQPYSDQ